MKVRVPLWGRPQGFVTVDADATPGAVVGTNLRWPDGSLVQEAELRAPAQTPPGMGVTLWRLVLEIPANVSAVAALGTNGFVRKAGATWTASAIVNADLSGANSDGLAEGVTNLYHTPERVRDVMGATLVAGSNITITVNDPGDTITIAGSGAAVQTFNRIDAAGDIRMAADGSLRITN